MSLKVTSHSCNSLVVELYQWQDKNKDHVCVGKFKISAVDDALSISALQDWKTGNTNDVELSYYANEPRFHLEKIGVFRSFKIKELVEKSSVTARTHL